LFNIRVWLVRCGSADGSLRSYCQWEAFNATCYRGDVIIVTSASYGRMRTGRCLAVRYAIGCSADVTDDVDRRCSGRRVCTINIPDSELVALQPCRKDLVAFMDAAYKCVTRKSSRCRTLMISLGLAILAKRPVCHLCAGDGESSVGL